MTGMNPTMIGKEKELSARELKRVFGSDAVVSRIGKFNLIHLDNPSPEEEARRVANFNPDLLFEDDCPICRMIKSNGGNVIYDDSF